MARVMPIMSQGQHLKLNKNTEDKIALFHCRFGERGSFNVKIYNRSCRSSIFLYVILKKRELTLETELQVLFVCSQKLQDEMMIKQTYFGEEALHKLSCRIYLAISQKNYRYKK